MLPETEGGRTPSKRIHSATSPAFKGLDMGEVSPIPSVEIRQKNECVNSDINAPGSFG